MSEQRCIREGLAKGKNVSVERCSCGHVHVTLGPLTVRIDATTLAELANVVGAASARVEEREGWTWRPTDERNVA
jgi:hypothetical protein